MFTLYAAVPFAAPEIFSLSKLKKVLLYYANVVIYYSAKEIY